MSWTFAALMPHPPVLVPDIGQGREKEAEKTLHGLAKLKNLIQKALTRHGPPELLLLASPHQPYIPQTLFINSAPICSGSLSAFGAPQTQFTVHTPSAALQSICDVLKKQKIPVQLHPVPQISQDHGSLVPLYFYSQALAETSPLPPIILCNPVGLTLEQAFLLGKILRSYSKASGWGLLASGDLSHRLLPQAPGGFHPAGEKFDETVVRALQQGNADILSSLPKNVISNAGECGLRSVLLLLGLCQESIQVLSYEGPFGVGYCTAFWSAQAVEQN